MPTATELPVDTSADAEAMANAIFGAGVTVESATYSGDPNSSGIYSNGDTVSPDATPGDTGVILSTGNATDFTNSDGSTDTNQSGSTTTDTAGVDGDGDFDGIANTNTFDAAFLEVVFTPTGDFITIDFVLSSEEYPEYANSAFNDVIGVWVNGVEATVSVGDGSASIGNINGGTTSNIYNDNTNDQFNTEMDGFTITLSFVAPVLDGQFNTLKIGIADVSDSGWDSNLLIAGGSAQTSMVIQDDEVTLGNNDTTTLNVLANDSSATGTLTVTQINGVNVTAGGTVPLGTGQSITLNDDGTFTITGDGDAETVYFNYTVDDGAGNTDTGLVEITQVPCFASGTWIETPEGAKRIETLLPGDLVITEDRGPQPLRWIGSRQVAATGSNRPIRFRKGAFGATSDLLVSPQHRMLIAHELSELLFGVPECLVKAKDLINDFNVREDRALSEVTYFHMLFDRHEIVTANGVLSESYHPGPMTMPGFDADTQQEIYQLIPDIRQGCYGPTARTVLNSREAIPLHAAIYA
jgi:hypothetical protein